MYTHTSGNILASSLDQFELELAMEPSIKFSWYMQKQQKALATT